MPRDIVFVLTQKTLPRRGCILKPIERPSSKNSTRDLKQVSWKTKTFLKKLEYRSLVQSTTNKSATFPYKIVLPKANGENKM